MVANLPRPVGPPNFHDGHICSVLQVGNDVRITVQGCSGKYYEARFGGVSSIESESPEGMMLYALHEAVGEPGQLRHYEFVNWYADEPSEERAKAHLRIVAANFTVTSSAGHQ
jgi:hypothetical protein